MPRMLRPYSRTEKSRICGDGYSKSCGPTGDGTAWCTHILIRRRRLRMRGWCIPQSGKDYEIKDKEAIEASPTDIENGALATDFRIKYMRIPASEPGNIVGYE